MSNHDGDNTNNNQLVLRQIDGKIRFQRLYHNDLFHIILSHNSCQFAWKKFVIYPFVKYNHATA